MAHLHLHRGQSSLLRRRQLWQHRCLPPWRPVWIHRGNQETLGGWRTTKESPLGLHATCRWRSLWIQQWDFGLETSEKHPAFLVPNLEPCPMKYQAYRYPLSFFLSLFPQGGGTHPMGGVVGPQQQWPQPSLQQSQRPSPPISGTNNWLADHCRATAATPTARYWEDSLVDRR